MWSPDTFMGKYRKIEPKVIPSCLIPHLPVTLIFTQQLEILVIALHGLGYLGSIVENPIILWKTLSFYYFLW